MKYASNNIRNILIAGHAGSGKTTLTEALVYFSGAAGMTGNQDIADVVACVFHIGFSLFPPHGVRSLRFCGIFYKDNTTL